MTIIKSRHGCRKDYDKGRYKNGTKSSLYIEDYIDREIEQMAKLTKIAEKELKKKLQDAAGCKKSAKRV